MPQTQEDFESSALIHGNADEYQLREDLNNNLNLKFLQKVSYFLSVGLVLFFLIDILAFMLAARLLLNVASTLEDSDKMEFRKPYIGLDELYKTHRIEPSPYRKVVNEPKLAAQISSADPHKIFPVDLHRWLSDFGFLSPPDRRLQLSKNIHTIIQFNVLDYGMEKCAIAVRLPSRGEILPHPYTLPSYNESISLSVCQLEGNFPMKESSISWSNRPACIRHIGHVKAKIGGKVEMEPFFCKSGSYLSYQISCAENSKGCDLDVWTNHNQTWGLFMYQYQTL